MLSRDISVMTRIKSGFSCRLRRAAAYCKTRRGGGLALSKAVKMGKKSRRQRDKGLSHSEGNKVINPNSVPPFMRGTIAKNNCIRSFFDNVRDGRVGSMAAAPFVTMFESHRRPYACRGALATSSASLASIPAASVPLLPQPRAPLRAALLGL